MKNRILALTAVPKNDYYGTFIHFVFSVSFLNSRTELGSYESASRFVFLDYSDSTVLWI